MPNLILSDIQFPLGGVDTIVDADHVTGQLLPFYREGYKAQIHDQALYFKDFPKLETDWKGGQAVWFMDVERDNSLHATVNNGAILSGSAPELVQCTVSAKWLAAPLILDEEQILASANSGPEQVGRTIARRMGKLARDSVQWCDRNFFADSTGVIITVSTEGAGTITPDTTTSLGLSGTLRLYRNMELEVWDSGYTSKKGNIFVLAVSKSAGTFTYSGTKGGTIDVGHGITNWAAGDVCLLRGCGAVGANPNRLMLGLDEHVDDTQVASSHQGVDRTIVVEYQAYRSAVNANLGVEHLNDLGQATYVNSGGVMPDEYCWNPYMESEYSELFQPNVQITPGGEVIGGFSNFKFQAGGTTMKFMAHPACPYDRIYALRKDSFGYLYRKDWHWRPVLRDQTWQDALPAGAILSNPDALNAKGTMLLCGEFVCLAPNQNGVLTDITMGIPQYGLY